MRKNLFALITEKEGIELLYKKITYDEKMQALMKRGKHIGFKSLGNFFNYQYYYFKSIY